MCELLNGLTYKQTAEKRGRAVSTIRTQAHGCFVRLGVAGQSQAMALFLQRGWLGWQPEREFTMSPFLHAYLDAFDQYLKTRDKRSRNAMRLALLGQATNMDAKLDLRRVRKSRHT